MSVRRRACRYMMTSMARLTAARRSITSRSSTARMARYRKRMAPSYSATTSSTPLALRSACCWYAVSMAVLSFAVRVVACDGVVELIDLVELLRDALQDLVGGVQLVGEEGLLRSDQRILRGNVCVQRLLLCGVGCCSKRQYAHRALVAQCVECVQQTLPEAAAILHESDNTGVIGVERGVERRCIERQRSIGIDGDAQLGEVANTPACCARGER